MHSYSKDDVEILTREKVYQGFGQLVRLTLRHRLFRGGWSETLLRELYLRRSAVGVLLVDVERECILAIRQFRTGLTVSEESPWSLEIVAGLIEPEEEPMEVAKREAEEEAGVHVLKDLRKVFDYWVNPGCSNEHVTLFFANVDSEGLGGVFGLPEEGEDIRVEILPFSEMCEALDRGEIRNSITLIAFQWLRIHWSSIKNAAPSEGPL